MQHNHKQLSWVGKITQFFLESRQFSLLLIFILFVWGLMSFIFMPKQYNPEITAPAFRIETQFPFASASEVRELITRPMEDAIMQIPEVDEVVSQSVAGGKSVVTVRFVIGSDVEDAKISLTQKLRDYMYLKPNGVTDPFVQAMSPDDVPVFTIALASDHLSETTLRKVALDVADDLKLAQGVSNYAVIGGQEAQVSIRVDAGKLEALSVSWEEVYGALQSAHVGTLITQLQDDESGLNTFFALEGSLNDVESIERVIVYSSGESVVTVGDIAEVAYDGGEVTSYVYRSENSEHGTPNTEQTTNFEDLDQSNYPPTPSQGGGITQAVFISFAKQKGENIINVTEGLEDRLDKLQQQQRFEDVHIQIANNEGETTREEIGKLTGDLTKSILIVSITLLIFLGLRSAFVVALTIPLVLLTVFGIGLLFDQSINRITLFALILSLGLLIDDAIVVVENIGRFIKTRLQEFGGNMNKLIPAAVDEVGGALIMSTVTLVLAFVPMAFVTGMMGPYMGPIPFFVPVALVASLFFAVSLNPYLSSVFLTKEDKEKHNIFIKVIKRLENVYGNFLEKLLTRRKLRHGVLAGVAISVVLSMALPAFGIVLFRMLPKADKDHFAVYVDLPENFSIMRTYEATQNIEDVIYTQGKDIVSIESFVGQAPVMDFSGLFRGSAERNQEFQSTLKVNLTSSHDRERTSEEIASSVRASLGEFKQNNPQVNVKLVEDPPGPPVFATLFLKVQGQDDVVRENVTQSIDIFLQSIDGVVDQDTSLADNAYKLTFQIDGEKAQRLGVRPTQVTQSVFAAVEGVRVGLYREYAHDEFRHGQQQPIILRLEGDDRQTLENIRRFPLSTPQGSVFLEEVLVPTDAFVPARILSDGRVESEYILAEMENRGVIYAVIDIFPQLLQDIPREHGLDVESWSLFGVTYSDAAGQEYQVLIDGEWKLTLEVFRDLGIVMGIVFFLIYFVLTAQTRSFLIPVLIMSSIPLSLVGILPGFAILGLIKGTYFNATSMIGFIALAGLSVKNAIIYLEYAQPRVKSGKDLVEALVEAGQIRLLPIILTSLTAILGSLTIISDPVWEGLAWSLIFGLLVSTILTMIVFPVLYWYSIRNNRDNT